mmetsp:Transcript_35652/g.90150  ORF Transcript_35652/g.90150 Transcript_35652/m.90150 type:complete len:444 (-) Transcript_35652:178-1509(-)
MHLSHMLITQHCTPHYFQPCRTRTILTASPTFQCGRRVASHHDAYYAQLQGTNGRRRGSAHVSGDAMRYMWAKLPPVLAALLPGGEESCVVMPASWMASCVLAEACSASLRLSSALSACMTSISRCSSLVRWPSRTNCICWSAALMLGGAVGLDTVSPTVRVPVIPAAGGEALLLGAAMAAVRGGDRGAAAMGALVKASSSWAALLCAARAPCCASRADSSTSRTRASSLRVSASRGIDCAPSSRMAAAAAPGGDPPPDKPELPAGCRCSRACVAVTTCSRAASLRRETSWLGPGSVTSMSCDSPGCAFRAALKDSTCSPSCAFSLSAWASVRSMCTACNLATFSSRAWSASCVLSCAASLPSVDTCALSAAACCSASCDTAAAAGAACACCSSALTCAISSSRSRASLSTVALRTALADSCWWMRPDSCCNSASRAAALPSA